jgi:hypothetical protein
MWSRIVNTTSRRAGWCSGSGRHVVRISAGLPNILTSIFVVFPQFLQTRVRTVPWNKPWPFLHNLIYSHNSFISSYLIIISAAETMSLNASFEAFMAVMYKVVVVLFVTACGVVVGYQCFGGACCLRLQGEVLLNNQRAYQPPYRHLRCYALWCSQYNCALFRVFSFVKNGVLYLRPTLTADEYGEHVLYRGAISAPGCNMDPCVS